MDKITIKHKVFMSVRVSNWLNRPIYDARLRAGRWEIRMNDTYPPIWQDLSAQLQGYINVRSR